MSVENQNCWAVYMHIFPNDKKYIGITKKKPEERWNNGNGYKSQSLMWKAIQKYGWNNITHKILYNNLSKEDAIAKEIELIYFYKTTNREFGYNITIGGEGTSGVSRSGSDAYWYGKQLSREHKQKVKENHADFNGGKHPRAKPVYCIELHMYFDCIRDAERKLGISCSHISACCKGKRNVAGGYHWVYANNLNDLTADLAAH